jgi:TonB-linked SusC/RagA family outer membrane protein
MKGLGKTALLALLAGAAWAPALTAQGTPGRVTGIVTSTDEARPMPGVNVIVKGSPTRTLTAPNGRYSIAAGAGDTLVFRFIGYAPQEIAVGGREVVNVVLTPQAVSLSAIVVTGYGTQQRRDVTGSIASVGGDELIEVATPSVAQALQGRVAGVQVTPESGEPGAGAVIRIRGTGTLNNASPLYVVDGMLLDDIGFLNPNDIQSLEVLKDASSTAIYGSRGANGVIIVTTKKGVLEQGTRFTLNSYAGMQSVLNRIDLANAQEYAILANEYAANTGAPPYFPSTAGIGEGVDWQDEIFENAPIMSHQVAAAGGTNRMTYYFSGNYFRQQGVLPKSDFNRLTVRTNNDYQLTPRLTLGHNINFSYTSGQVPPGVLGVLYRADPSIAPRNPDGTFANNNLRASAGNPAATVFYTRNEEDGRRLVGNIFGDLNFLQNFAFRSSFGFDNNESQYRNFVPVYVVSPTQQNTDSDLTVRNNTVRSWLWENTVNWNWSTDRHRVNALAGITTQSFYSDSIGGTRTNLVGDDPNLWYLEAGDAEGQTNFHRGEDWRMLSYLFRTNYSLLDRYLLTASLRVDGSSRFGSDNRFGYFPSFALGWNIHEEDFFPDLASVDALKLRASWGRIGNDKIGAYPGIPVVSGNLNAVFGASEELAFGASPVELANPDVKWETTTSTNFGLDGTFLRGRFLATFDFYDRLTDGILVRVPIPRYVGVSTEPFVNAAEVQNRGLEGSLTWTQSSGDFSYELNVNGSTLHNEVKSLGGGREEILGGGLGNEVTFSTRTVVGEPIGSFWGYRVAGVFQTAAEIASSPRRGGEVPGDLRYEDLNGDGAITDGDKTFIGSPIPNFIYGLNGRMSWRSFDVSASFSGQSGNEVLNGKRAVRFGVENFERAFLNRWNGPGSSNTEPRITNAGHNYQASTRFIEDGSFFKLQSAQLGYRLPTNLARRLTLETARIYVNGTNLFNITDYSGYTPELTVSDVIRTGIDLGVFPPSRIITLGLDVTF